MCHSGEPAVAQNGVRTRGRSPVGSAWYTYTGTSAALRTPSWNEFSFLLRMFGSVHRADCQVTGTTVLGHAVFAPPLYMFRPLRERHAGCYSSVNSLNPCNAESDASMSMAGVQCLVVGVWHLRLRLMRRVVFASTLQPLQVVHVFRCQGIVCSERPRPTSCTSS